MSKVKVICLTLLFSGIILGLFGFGVLTLPNHPLLPAPRVALKLWAAALFLLGAWCTTCVIGEQWNTK